MNERVIILREAVVKITQMLSGKGIQVTQRGVNAYVKSDSTGKPVLVNLPYLPDNATEELCMAIQGFLDHEVAHIMFSDFSLLDEAAKAGCQSMLNIIEDARVEKAMAARFSGCGHNLAVTGRFFLDKYTTPAMKQAAEAGDANRVIATLLVPLIRAMSGQFVYKEYIKDKMHILDPVYSKIADLEKKIEGCSSTAEALDLAKEIEKRLRSGSGSDPKNGEGDEGESEGEGESESEGKVKSVKKGKKSKSEEPEGEGEDKGEGEQAEEGGENEGAGAGSGEDEESGEEGAAGEEEAEGEGEGEGSEKSSAGSSDETTESSEKEKNTKDTSAIWEAIDKEGANDFDKSVSSAIANAAVDAAKHADYLVYTKDGDVIEPLKVGSGFNSRMVADLCDSVDHMVGPLQKDLERAIAARSLATWEAGKRSGRLHSANLSRLAVGDSRVFRRRHETTSKDVAVSLVIDASGSMSGAKIYTATQAAYALSSVLERIGINHEVIAFTTGEPCATPSELESEQRKIGRHFTRIEGLYMPVIKGFNERLKTEVKERFGWLPNSRILRNNIDGECVEIAARRLIGRRESGKVMIVLSDGAPACQGDMAALQRHLKNVVRNVEKAGVKTVGIGIQSNEVTRFYPKNIVLNNVSELPDRVIKELRHMLVH